MFSTILDVAGLILIIAAAFIAFGLAGAALAAGVCCLVASFTMSRVKK